MKNMQTVARRSHRGFTLIELMVTVAIVAILASVAIPSYRDYVTRGRIPDATNGLSTLRTQMEQYYLDNRTYVGGCAATTVPLPTSSNFTFSCTGLTPSAFTATATGTGTMAGFVYAVNESNTRTTTGVPASSGWGTTPANCWIVRKGGGC